MSGPVVVAVLFAAALHAGWNALVKGRTGSDPLVSSTGLSAAWALLATPLLWLVPAPPPEVLPFFAASVVVHLAYFTLLVMAYRHGDLSVVYPVARGTPPMLVTLVAALLGEVLSAAHLAGVVVLTAGILFLSPWHAADVSRRTWGFALGSACATATYTLLDGHVTRLWGSALATIVWLTAVQGTLFVVGSVLVRGPAVLTEVWKRRVTALGAGVMSAVGYGVALWAMLDAPIAAVAALRESSVPFAALLAVVWLGEPLGVRRLGAIVLVAVGAVLFRLG